MKHYLAFIVIILLALSMTGMGQENLREESEIPSEQSGKTTDEPEHIYVLGEVVNPGEYIISQLLTLMDAIKLAGGLEPNAARYAYLHRPIKEGEVAQDSDLKDQTKLLANPESSVPGKEIIRIDLKPMKNGGVPVPNIPMRAGDSFVIPRSASPQFYIIGDVGNPGTYKIESGQTILSTQAISIAGGPLKTAKMSEGVILRFDKEGKRQELKVDFKAILEGKLKDIEILPNDIIFIPGINTKTITPLYRFLPIYDPPPNWRELPANG